MVLECLLAGLLSAPPVGLRFDEAIGLARRAPSVVAAERAVAAKRALDASLARVLANPQLTLQPGARVAPGREVGPELVAELSQTWNLAGAGRARRAAAGAETETLSAEARAVALGRRLAVAASWLELRGAERALEALRRDRALAEELVDLVERAALAQAVTQADVADATAYAVEARLAELAAEGEVFERGIELARAAGIGKGEPIVTSGEPPAPRLPAQAEWPSIVARAASLPQVVAERLRGHAERARLAEEHAARGAWLQTGVLASRDAVGATVLALQARLGLPLLERGERERGVLAAQAERTEGGAEDAAVAAASELAVALHEVEHAGRVLAELRQRLAPTTARAATLRQRAFLAGDATSLEVLQARRTAVAAEVRLARAEARSTWAGVRAWLLLASLEDRR